MKKRHIISLMSIIFLLAAAAVIFFISKNKTKINPIPAFNNDRVAIVILDSITDSNHDFLKDKVIFEHCIYIEGSYKEDDISLCQNKETSEHNLPNIELCKTTPSFCKHATHVSGIAAGYNANLNEIHYDSKVDIISITVHTGTTNPKVCQRQGQNPCTYIYTNHYQEALKYVIELKKNQFPHIAAINMSFWGSLHGSETSCGIYGKKTNQLAKELKDLGVITVASTGNDGLVGKIGMPACLSNVISVSNVDYFNSPAREGSNKPYGDISNFTDFYASGVNIYSTYPNNIYSIDSGTSMAAPKISRLYAHMIQKHPYMSLDDITKTLKISGNPITWNNLTISIPSLGRAEDYLTNQKLTSAELSQENKNKLSGLIKVLEDLNNESQVVITVLDLLKNRLQG